MAFLSGLFGGNDSASNAAASAVPFQLMGAQQSLGALGSAYDTAKKEYGTNYYDPYTTTDTNANTMYANALGFNGASGNKAATDAFPTNPGYNFQLQQGIQALDRSAAGSGLFGSGNAAMALNQYGQGLANQDYGNWLSRLQGLGAQGLTAAAGQTGRQGSLAGIDTGLGNAQAGVWNNLDEQCDERLHAGPASGCGVECARRREFIQRSPRRRKSWIEGFWSRRVRSCD